MPKIRFDKLLKLLKFDKPILSDAERGIARVNQKALDAANAEYRELAKKQGFVTPEEHRSIFSNVGVDDPYSPGNYSGRTSDFPDKEAILGSSIVLGGGLGGASKFGDQLGEYEDGLKKQPGDDETLLNKIRENQRKRKEQEIPE